MELKTKGILKSSFFVSVIVILVKLFGFFKQAVVSSFYGASEQMDTFLLASGFVVGIGTAFFASCSIGIIAIYQNEKNRNGHENSFISHVFATLFLVSVVITVSILLFATNIAEFIAPGYEFVQLKYLEKLIRQFSVLVINMCFSYISISILESEKVFLPGKLIGFFLSASVIISCVLFANVLGIMAMFWGYILYYWMENLFLFYCLKKKVSSLKLKIEWPIKDPNIVRLFQLSFPLFISNSLLYLSNLVDKSIASNLTSGSITAISNGHDLFSTVHAVIVGSFCTVFYSYIAGFVDENLMEMQDYLKNAMNIIFAVLSLGTLVFILHSEFIITIIYGWGKYGDIAVKNTSIALRAYVIGFVFIAFRDVLIRVHYAFHDTKYPMIIGIVEILFNILLSVVLGNLFGIFGITIATSISIILSCCITFYSLRRHMPYFKYFNSNLDFWKVLLAIAVSALFGSAVKFILQKGSMTSIIAIFVEFLVFIVVLIIAKSNIWKMAKQWRGNKYDQAHDAYK